MQSTSTSSSGQQVQGGDYAQSQRIVHPNPHYQQQQQMRGYTRQVSDQQATINTPARQNLPESNPLPPSSASSNTSSSRHAVPFPLQQQHPVMYAPLPFPPSEHPLPPPSNTNRPQPHLVIPDYIPSRLAISHPQPSPPSQQQQQQTTSSFPPAAPSQAVPPPVASFSPYPQFQMAYPTPPQYQHHYSLYPPPPPLPQYSTMQYAPQFHHHAPPPQTQMITPFPPIPLRHLEAPSPQAHCQTHHTPLPQRPLAVLPPVTNQLPEIARGSIQQQSYFTPPPAHSHSQAQLYPMYPPGIPLHQQQYQPQMRHASFSTTTTHQSDQQESPSPLPRGRGGAPQTELTEYPISSSSSSPTQIRQIPLRLSSSEPILFETKLPATQLPSPPASSSHSQSQSETTTLASPPPAPQTPPSASTSSSRPLPRAPSGITPALPPSSLLTNPQSSDDSTPTCQVSGCRFPRFCILSPCGDIICRDHLGSVIRGVQILEEEGEGEGEGKKKRVYECVKCRKRSEMAGPTREQKERLKRGSVSSLGSGIGLGLDLGEPQHEGGGDSEESFSIHYFSKRGSHGGSVGWEGQRRSSSTSSYDRGYGQGLTRRESQTSSSIPEERGEGEEEQAQVQVQTTTTMYQPYPIPISIMGPSMLIPKPPSPPLPFPYSQSIPVYPISHLEPQTTYYQTPYEPQEEAITHAEEEEENQPEHERDHTPLATPLFSLSQNNRSPPPLSSLSPPSSPPATRSDVSHLISGDPSILQVSHSPKSPSSESPTSPYPFRPTSSFFAGYQFPPSPTSSRGRGRGHGRGRGRGRGASQSQGFRRNSFAYSAFSQEEEEDWDENGERVVDPPSAIQQVQAFVKRREEVKEELRGRFCVVKVENIPFGTTYRSIMEWIPEGILPSSQECPQPIHLILHRATGRTLPHCYIEVKDEPSAVLLLEEHDRSSLGDRTVRVKMERIGELMRDLFDQSKYFIHAPHLFNAASAPLPQLPQDGYALPSDRPILGESDIQALSSWLGPPPWSGAAGKPAERVYTNLVSIITKLPWKARPDLWDETLRLQLFTLASRAIHQAQATRGYRQDEYKAIANRLIDTIVDCPGFTPAQRAQYSVLSPLDFPPLSPNSKLTLPRSSNPTDFADSPSPSVTRPPPSAILDTSGSLPFVESGSEEWLAPSEGFTAAKEALLRPKSSEGGEVEESGTCYWADEPCPPLARIEQEREQVSHRHVPSVSIPRSGWADASTLSPTTPLRSPSPPLQSLQYPMTPPESPENTRKNWGSPYRGRGRARGGWKQWESPASHRSSSFSSNNLNWS